MTLKVQFFTAEHNRSAGVLEIRLSDRLEHSISNCIAQKRDFVLPSMKDNEYLLELRIVKKYPWITVRCNGMPVIKHHFFSFKNSDCRSEWAIKGDMVSVGFESTGHDEMYIKISEQGKLL